MSRTGETRINNFGSTMIITAYRGCMDIDVYFEEYEYIAEHRTYQQFKNGNIKCPYEPRVYNTGYLGEGPFLASENGKKTRAYNTWKEMLRRCCDVEYHKRQPTYKDCEVCEEWLNFQNFAEWYEENYYEIPGEQMALDKDILTKGNKVYSPESCVFVPKSINSLFVKCDSTRGDLPIGVSYNKQRKKYIARCNIRTGKIKHLGCYDMPEEAFNIYKTFKEAYIKKVANDYIEDIPFNLYQAMINYEVDTDD